MGMKVRREPLIETRGTDVASRAAQHTRTLVLSKSATGNGLGYMLLVTFTASDDAHAQPEAILQSFGAERAPISFGLDGEAFAAFVDEANAWLEQHPVKATPAP
jgi:hypothetical protein